MIKKGVRLHGVCSQMFWAASTVRELWSYHNYPFTITAGIEGKHSATSDHWGGCALDFRTWKNLTGQQISNEEKVVLKLELQRLLGEEYFILMEKDHLHISYRALKAL